MTFDWFMLSTDEGWTNILTDNMQASCIRKVGPL